MNNEREEGRDLNDQDGWQDKPEGGGGDLEPQPDPQPEAAEESGQRSPPKEAPTKRRRRSLKQAEKIVRTSILRSIRAGLIDGLTNEEMESIVEGLDFLGYLPPEFVSEALQGEDDA